MKLLKVTQFTYSSLVQSVIRVERLLKFQTNLLVVKLHQTPLRVRGLSTDGQKIIKVVFFSQKESFPRQCKDILYLYPEECCLLDYCLAKAFSFLSHPGQIKLRDATLDKITPGKAILCWNNREGVRIYVFFLCWEMRKIYTKTWSTQDTDRYKTQFSIK